MHINALRKTKNIQIKRIAFKRRKSLRENAYLLQVHQYSPIRQ